MWRKRCGKVRILSLLILPACMTGCATAPVSEPAIVPHANPCDTLPLPVYPHEFSVALDDELLKQPPASHLEKVVSDYMNTRDAIRRCRAGR